MHRIITFAILASLSAPSLLSAQSDELDRIGKAATVLTEILNIPEGVPAEVLDKAECVIVLPSVVKFAIGIGGSYGRGVMTCRRGAAFDGPWSPPSMMMVAGGSIGLQLGGQATDFVLFVMNPRGANAILASQVKLGADLSAAAGPKGRTLAAGTDATMRAEILSYSRSRGLFAGISLEGSTLRPDNDGNKSVYRSAVTARAVVLEARVAPPAAARSLVGLLNAKSPKNLSEVRR